MQPRSRPNPETLLNWRSYRTFTLHKIHYRDIPPARCRVSPAADHRARWHPNGTVSAPNWRLPNVGSRRIQNELGQINGLTFRWQGIGPRFC